MKSSLRMANQQDAAAIRALYAPYCESTVISFEAHAPSLEEMEARIRKITDQFPWLVCVRDGELLGYAYAGPHHERAAYRWSVDAAVYVDARRHR